MESIFFKHAKLLEGRDPEEVKKFVTFLFLTFWKLQHTTSDLGVFFGGMYKGSELFLSLIHRKFEIPKIDDLKKEHGELEKLIGPYVDTSFELFEDWKRKTEEFQINKGVNLFNRYESSVSNLYKEYQKRSQR